MTYNSIQGSAEVPFTIPACDAATVNLIPDTPPTFPAPLVVVPDGVVFSGWPDLDVYLQQQVRQMEQIALTGSVSMNTASGTQPISVASLTSQVAAAATTLCNTQAFNNKQFKGGVDPACADTTAAVAQYTTLVTTWANQAIQIQTLLGTIPGTTCGYCKFVATPAVPMPVRGLNADEILQPSFLSMMGNGPIVVAKASAALGAPTPVTLPSGGVALMPATQGQRSIRSLVS